MQAQLSGLTEQAAQASAMIGKGKELKGDASTIGKGMELVANGEQLRDRVLHEALALAESGATEPGTITEGFLPLATDQHRIAAAIAANVARERALDELDAMQEHAKIFAILNRPTRPEVMNAPGEDLALAYNAVDSSRYDANHQPVFAPEQHLTAIDIITRQAALARVTGNYGPVEVSLDKKEVGSDMLLDFAEARRSVAIVRAQREALKGMRDVPPEAAAPLAQLEPAAAVLSLETTGAVTMIAGGMLAALAEPQQIAMMPLDEGIRVALMHVADSVRASVGAQDGASFRAAVGSTWPAFVQKFFDGQMRQIEPNDPHVQQAIANAQQNVAAVNGLVMNAINATPDAQRR